MRLLHCDSYFQASLSVRCKTHITSEILTCVLLLLSPHRKKISESSVWKYQVDFWRRPFPTNIGFKCLFLSVVTHLSVRTSSEFEASLISYAKSASSGALFLDTYDRLVLDDFLTLLHKLFRDAMRDMVV